MYLCCQEALTKQLGPGRQLLLRQMQRLLLLLACHQHQGAVQRQPKPEKTLPVLQLPLARVGLELQKADFLAQLSQRRMGLPTQGIIGFTCIDTGKPSPLQLDKVAYIAVEPAPGPAGNKQMHRQKCH